jgi:YD repeat-containing protein
VRRSGAAGADFTYNRSGDLLTDPEIGTLQYDVRHRLVRVDRPDGTVVAVAYDHDDRASRPAPPIREVPPRRRLEVDSIYIVDDSGTIRRLRRGPATALLPWPGAGCSPRFDRLRQHQRREQPRDRRVRRQRRARRSGS